MFFVVSKARLNHLLHCFETFFFLCLVLMKNHQGQPWVNVNWCFFNLVNVPTTCAFSGTILVFSVRQVCVIYSVTDWNNDRSLPEKNKINVQNQDSSVTYVVLSWILTGLGFGEQTAALLFVFCFLYPGVMKCQALKHLPACAIVTTLVPARGR